MAVSLAVPGVMQMPMAVIMRVAVVVMVHGNVIL